MPSKGVVQWSLRFMKIFLHQTPVSDNMNLNFQKLYEVFENNLTVDLIICPEVFTSGFNFEKLDEITAENKEILKKIQTVCGASQTAFLGSFLWKEGVYVYNRSFFVDETGNILGIYDKQRLIPAFKEEQYLKAGSKNAFFTFKGMQIGLAICYDLRFPEIFRKYAGREADIIFLPAQWPQERIEHMVALARARAIENQCYFVVVNAVGKSGKRQMGGHSMVINPKGDIVLDLNSATKGDQIQVHLSEILKWRTDFPALYQYSRPLMFSSKILRWLNK